MIRIFRLLLCIVGLFVHCHKTQNRIQIRCDVRLYVCKYNGPTAKSILFIYVKSHRVIFCEEASFRQLALVLLLGDVALYPGPMKFGFANCRSIRNKGSTLCKEGNTGNFDVFGLTETHIKALDRPSFLNELTPEDFSLVHTNRENIHGGGVGFFIYQLWISKPSIFLVSPPLKITLSLSLSTGVACFLACFLGYPIRQQIIFKTLVLVYKYLTTGQPKYFAPYLSLYKSAMNTRRSNPQNLFLQVPHYCASIHKSKVHFNNSFSYDAPK